MEIDRLSLRDLKLEAELEKISKKTQQSKEEQDVLPTNLINTLVTDINLKTLGIEEQLQKISRNAIKDVLGWKPTKVKSDVTNEMIQEYQDEIANSFYDDPITGRRLKYVPVNTDIQLETFVPKVAVSANDEEAIRDSQRQLVETRKRYEVRLLDLIDRLEEFKKSVEIGTTGAKPPPGVSLIPEEVYLREVEAFQGGIDGIREDINNVDGILGKLEESLKGDAEIRRENQAEKDRIQKANYATLKAKSEELNYLNSGRLNLVRQPNETDEDFQQRLVEVGQIEFDEQAIEQQAARRATNKFKENMKKIIRNNILIENIIKSVEPGRLFLYNKYFSSIEKKFSEVYKNAIFTENDIDELIDIFDNIIGKVTFEMVRNEPTKTEFLPAFAEAQVISPSQIETPKKRGRPPKTQPTIEMLSALKKREPAFDKAWITARGSTNPNTVWDATTTQVKIDFGDDYRITSGRALPGNRERMFRELYEYGFINPPTEIPRQRPEGSGLKHENLPKFSQLGKIAIDPHALYYQNVLKVTTHNKHHLLGYKNRRVSEDMVTILMNLWKGTFPTGHDLKKLDVTEKELYDNLVHLAHLHKKVEHNLPQTRQAMKHRFELLNGEIGAGNTNKELRDELKQLLHKMAYGGMISHTQVGKYLKSINYGK